MPRPFVTFLLLSLLSTFAGFGQRIPLASSGDEYVIKTWTVEDGLPESSPTSITQTRDGYLWVGTWNGLARFDGLRFTSFHSGNTPAFTVSRIGVLFADTDGTVWIGTGGGGIVRYRSGTFRRFGTEHGLGNLFVSGCARDTDGTLWVGTEDGLYRMEGERFMKAPFAIPGYGPKVFRVYAHSPGGIIVNLEGGGFLGSRADDGSMTVERFFDGGEVVLDAKDRIWHWDRQNTLHMVEGRREKSFNQFKHLRVSSTQALISGGVGICFLNSVATVGDEGIVYLPSVGTSPLTANECLFEDREGNVWLGRASSGLSRIRKRSVSIFSTGSGLSSDVAASVIEDARGRLWVGTYRQGLNLFRDGKFVPFISAGIKATHTVNLLWKDPDGMLWAGPHLQGFVSVHPDPTRRYDRGIVTPWVTVRAVDVSPDGSWWLGTSNEGVQRDSAGIVTVWNESAGLSSNDISAVLCASDGSTWVGTSFAGMNRIAGDSVQRIGTYEGLSSNEVMSMYEDEDNGVWIATRRGLNCWKDGTIRALYEEDGLADEAISSIVEDGRGFLWFGGTKGIFRASLKDLNERANGGGARVRVRAFGTEDGLVSSEVGGGGNPRSWRDRQGILWFASERGLIRLDPSSLDENNVPPPVIVEDILVDHKPIEDLDRVVMNPGDSKIEISFTGISFRSPQKVRFRYRMEGLEDVWQEGGTRRTVQYTNLPSGEYTFRVLAANSDGIWNENGATLAVIVIPPFYESWWFVAIVLLTFLTSGPTIYFLRVRALKREHQRQQEFGRKLIERQEEERRRIARDMHDSLGQELLVLKHRIQTRLRKGRIAKETASLLNDLSGTVGGTITLVRHISHNLRPPELDRLGLTETLKAMLERIRSTNVFETKGIVDDVDGFFESEDEINVVRIVQEALSNAIKHSGATRVSVIVSSDDRRVEIRVEDDGVGIHTDEDPAAGIGLADMRERAALMNGTCEHSAGEKGGTVVRVVLPRRNSNDR